MLKLLSTAPNQVSEKGFSPVRFFSQLQSVCRSKVVLPGRTPIPNKSLAWTSFKKMPQMPPKLRSDSERVDLCGFGVGIYSTSTSLRLKSDMHQLWECPALQNNKHDVTRGTYVGGYVGLHSPGTNNRSPS